MARPIAFSGNGLVSITGLHDKFISLKPPITDTPTPCCNTKNFYSPNVLELIQQQHAKNTLSHKIGAILSTDSAIWLVTVCGRWRVHRILLTVIFNNSTKMVEYTITPVMETERVRSRKGPLTVIKFLELCLSAVCTFLHFYSFDDYDLVTCFLATGTFCGFDLILFATMAGKCKKLIIGYGNSRSKLALWEKSTFLH